MTSLVEPRGNVQGADPNQYKWIYTYDNADRPLTQTDPLGNVTSWVYDEAGLLTSRTDAKNRTTSWGYNPANQLTSVTAPGNRVTSYAYDPAGNLRTRTDAENHITTFGYDQANRLTSVTSPIGQLWTYEYDGAGNLTKMVDAAGNATQQAGDGTTTYTIDALNRLTGIDYSDSTPDVTLAYDANSNRTSMTDGAGTETYVYDDLNRLITVTRGSQSFSYQYDAADAVTKRTYPDGTVVDYTFDDDGRLSTVTSGGSHHDLRIRRSCQSHLDHPPRLERLRGKPDLRSGRAANRGEERQGPGHTVTVHLHA
jgi:YD repeat-containing protein